MNRFFCLYFFLRLSLSKYISDICIFSKAMQKYKEDFDQRTWIIYFECTWGECGCGCCVWAVVCQMRLVWFLCKNILSRSVCQEVRWWHWPMRGCCEEAQPIRGERELCLRCGEMFGLNLALFEFLRLYPRFYQVPALVTFPDTS